MQSVREYLGGELLHLGITMRYKGYSQTIFAVEMALADPESLTLVSKRIYPEVGKRFGVSWRVAERNIRTVVDLIWELNPEGLSCIAGYELRRKPTTSDFISIMVNDVNLHFGSDNRDTELSMQPAYKAM